MLLRPLHEFAAIHVGHENVSDHHVHAPLEQHLLCRQTIFHLQHRFRVEFGQPS